MPAEKVQILELGYPHKKQILFLESGFGFSSLKDFRFPPTEIKDRIGQLKKITFSATNLQEKGVQAVEELAKKERVVVDVSYASIDEKKALEVSMSTKNIVLVDDKKETDPILRDICTQIVSYRKKGNNPAGAIAFNIFIKELFSKYRGVTLKEWNDYIVEHPVSKNAKSARDTHHYTNVGLLTETEGNDSLRDEVIAFVEETMNDPEIYKLAKKIFNNGERKTHNAIIKFKDFLLALGMADFSNFVRGGVLVRGRKGDDEKFFTENEYMPRRLAAEIMDEVSDVIEEKNK